VLLQRSALICRVLAVLQRQVKPVTQPACKPDERQGVGKGHNNRPTANGAQLQKARQAQDVEHLQRSQEQAGQNEEHAISPGLGVAAQASLHSSWFKPGQPTLDRQYIQGVVIMSLIQMMRPC